MVMSFLSVDDAATSTNPYEKYLRVPPQKQIDNSRDSDDFEDSDDDEDDLEGLPITHKFDLTKSKGVHCLKFSKSGNRLLSTTRGSMLDVYEFQAMNPVNTTPNRSYEPYETHDVTTLDVNSKDQILACVNDPVFKLLAGDGSVLKDFSAGDRYLYDVKQTKGHTDSITDGHFYANDKIITSSNDSTFRIWDVQTAKQEKVNFMKSSKGKKVKVLSVTSTPANIIATDSTHRVTLWDPKALNFTRPVHTLELDSDITAFAASSTDPTQILLRQSDSLKLYDTRNLTTPLIQKLSFPSPSKSSLLLHGSHVLCPGASNSLHILHGSDLMTISTMETESLVTAINWNHKIEQIAVGTELGHISVLFDPVLSKNGVMTSTKNKPKRRHIDEQDQMTTNAKQVAYNMDELMELRKSKKQKNAEDD